MEIPGDLEPLFPARVMGGTRPHHGGMRMSHYFGTVQTCTQIQYEYPGDLFCVIADFHALTSQPQEVALADSVRTFALDYLALGLDPSVSILYQQSDVPQICELMWILGCAVHKTRLDRALPYRAVAERDRGGSLGLFLYPMLLSADVLALRATDIALAEDQEPMVEIVREIAHAFNHRRGTVFPRPQLRRAGDPALRGAARKLDSGSGLPVFWTDEEDLQTRVMHMVTSSVALGEPIDPERCSVFALYRLVADPQLTEEMREGFERGRLGYRDAKRMLIAALRSYFAPHREQRRKLETDQATLDDVLQAGARRVREEAEATLDTVRECAGLTSYRRRLV